jgi:predicted O-methyltransferase YrrM
MPATLEHLAHAPDNDYTVLEVVYRFDGEGLMYLDSCSLLNAQVGYGGLGTGGSLGYEDKQVIVRGSHYQHALSTHPPSRLLFDLGGCFNSFHCHVALNDDVPSGSSYADFTVLADGRQVATAPHVIAGAPPRLLSVDLMGAQQLELVVSSRRWEYAHAVWIDPQVAESKTELYAQPFPDCLDRTEITPPALPLHAKRCIASIVSPGFETLLDDMLGSLYAYGQCQDALVVVFVVGENAKCDRVIAKYEAVAVRCRPQARINPTVKSTLYSVARVVDAEQFICLDADMLVLGDLRPIFGALDACPKHTILACREGNGQGWHTFQSLSHALTTVYGGQETDLQRLLGTVNGEGAYSLVVNDGLFAGSRNALLTLDSAIRDMREASAWTDEQANIWWRNQFVFNLALARLHCGVELDPIYNVQLNSHDLEFQEVDGRIKALWYGRSVRVAHFNGLGRNKNPEWRNRFAGVTHPLVGKRGSDSYQEFLAALRAWVGRYGLKSLAWSFYGTADATSARAHEPSTLPLLALLHYLIRANGCVRVLETGTARGVSTACLASAVAHRIHGRVVTFDPAVYAEREQLWAALPETMGACIEVRQLDSLQGMAIALEIGERYDAALLDSLHTAEHVWAEFQLATQLVCPSGLILIHDACLSYGTVTEALERIKTMGYGVTRLWSAASGEQEDDHLGLAVIENWRCKN